MNDFPQQEQPTSDTFDFSDNEALQPPFQSQSQPPQYQLQSQQHFKPQPSRHGEGLSTVGSSDMSRITNIDRNAYSDEGKLRLNPLPLRILCSDELCY